jgi:uncharacterized protein YcnI
MQIRRFTLPTLGATAALGVVALTTTAASAHVSVSPDTTAAGAYAVLTFSVPHGCEGSPTTKIAIQVPDQITSVTPTVNPNWDVRKVTAKLAQPIKDDDGNEITERVSQVVYTAKTPLADGYRDTLALSLQLPAKEGESLQFPVVQTCEKGQTSWNETAAEGQDPETLQNPAPTLTITAATGEGHHGAADPTAAAESDASAAPASNKTEGDSGNMLAIGGLAVGAAGLGVAVIALGRTRPKA